MADITRTPTRTRRGPSSDLRNLQREVDRIFNNFLSPRSGQAESAVWSPQTDLVETDDEYRIHLDMPGISRDDITINYQDNTLTVHGTRREEQREETAEFVRTERAFGEFHRSFTLPRTVDAEAIEANFDNGVLSIHVPKTEKSKKKKIEIQ